MDFIGEPVRRRVLRSLFFLVFSSVLFAFAQADSVLNFPRMTSAAETLTGIAIVNTGDRDARVVLTGYDAGGREVAASGDKVELIVPAGQQVSRLLPELFGAAASSTRWVQAISTGDGLAGFFLYLDGADTFLDGADLPVASSRIVFNQVRLDSGATTELNIFNPGTTAAAVQLQLAGAGGASVSRDVTLPAKGGLRADAASFFGVNNARAAAYVTATSDVPIAGMEFVKMGDGRDLLGLNARPGDEQLRTLFFPQMAVLGSWSTTLGLINYSTSPSLVTLSAYKPDGTLYGSASVKNNPVVRPLDGGTSLVEDVETLFGFSGTTTLDGWIKVESSSPAINGYVSYGTSRSIAAVASAPEGATTAIFSHIATTGAFFTGLAALNPGSLAVNLRIVALRPTGQVLGSYDTVLQPGQRLSNLINNLIPQANGQSGGVIWVRSDQPLYFLELFGTGNTLATVPSQPALETFKPDVALASLKMNPPLAPVEVGKTQLFQLENARGSFNWKINGVTGGSASLGTINSSGVYRAPASPPSPQTLTITAEGVSQIAGGSADVLKKQTLVGGLGVVQSLAYLKNAQKLFAAELSTLSTARGLATTSTSGIYDVSASGAKSLVIDYPGEVISKMIVYIASDGGEYLLMAGKASGNIYRLNPANKQSVVVARGLNQPNALAVDPATGDLLVAEVDRITVVARRALESTGGVKTGAEFATLNMEGLEPERWALLDAFNTAGIVADPCTGRVFTTNATQGSIVQYDQRAGESSTVVTGLKNPGQMVGLRRAGVSCPAGLQLLVLERGLDRVSLIVPGDSTVRPWAPANGSTDIVFIVHGKLSPTDGLAVVESTGGPTKGLLADGSSDITFYSTPGVYDTDTTNPTSSDAEQVVLRPLKIRLTRGATQQFTAIPKNDKDGRVIWTATGGTVTASGLYTAPNTLGTYSLRATAVSDPKKFADASITVETVSIAVNPALTSIATGATQQFTAAISGSTNTAATWAVLNGGGGTISSAGLYTAPASPGTTTVRATSQADGDKFAEAKVTVFQVTVGIDPVALTLLPGATQQFSAAVSGTSNTDVTWSVTGGGAISSSGLYTAPSTVGTGRVRATSAADPNKFAEANVTVSEVSVSVDPGSVSMITGETRAFTATVTGNPNTAVNWTASSGFITSSGTYTAPNIPGAQTVRATSVVDSRRFADAAVTVNEVAVGIDPLSVSLVAGGTQQFTASVTGSSNVDVTWSVVTAGGGTITASGLYTAPAASGTYRVRATATADPRKSAEATVNVSPVGLILNPQSAKLIGGGSQQFTARVTGAADTSVTWSATGGVITTGGLYTAPDTAGPQTVRAVSNFDTRSLAEATVTIDPPAIVISPASGASIPTGQTLQFSATVSSATNTGVIWSVPTVNGGTISTTGLYTAPATAGIYTVRAASAADNRFFAESQVAVDSVSVTVQPASGASIFDGQTLQLTATVTGTSDKRVTWSVTSANGGSVSSTGLYTAPAAAGTFTVRATSTADTRKFAEAVVTVQAGTVSISPTTASLNQGATQQFTSAVLGLADNSVNWSVEGSGGGTVSSAGLYTAPGRAGTFTVRATSKADPRKFADAVVTVKDITVSISPTGSTLLVGETEQFSAQVQGSTNTGVNWSVQTSGGGTISSTGLYTAPATTGFYTVRAASRADSTKFADVFVTVFSITLSPANPSLITAATLQFTAQVVGTSQNGITWSATGGTINSAGLYTAPDQAGSYRVRATSASFTTKFAETGMTVTDPSIGVSPSAASLDQGATQRFTATVSDVPAGGNTGVTWSVTTANGGSVDASGLYTAPNAGGTYTVRATSKADPRKFSDATVTVRPVGISVSPTQVTMLDSTSQAFSATVTGTVNTAVAWSVVTQGGGTITSAGFYTAPSTAGTYTVRATSSADPTRTADIAVTVQLVVVTMNPTSATVNQGANWQANATVSGTGDTAVTWSVVSAPSGPNSRIGLKASAGGRSPVSPAGPPAAVGTINSSGVFTAPNSAGTYTITATSTADPRKSANATVTVPAVGISISPTSVTLYQSSSQSFSSSVTGTVNTAVTYSVISPGGGAITSAGFYTAPSSPGARTVRVTSDADPAAYAEATVDVFTLTLSPSTATMDAGSSLQFTATITGTPQNGITWSATGGSVNSSGLYTAPTSPGSQTVRATSQSFPTRYVEAVVTINPAAVSATNSTVIASPTSVTADGVTSSTVVVTLKDAYGNPVSGKTVTLGKNSGNSTITTVSGVTNAGGQATFTVKDTVAETTTYTATDATDSNLVITPTASVTFVPGAVSASTSMVVASPASIVADGTTTSVITVTLKDANANTVSGKNVTLAKNSGSSTITTVSGVTNAGGQASFTVKDSTAETTTYIATDTTDSNLVITQTATVTFVAGSVSASTSTVAASPSSVVADGSTASTITVTLKDANGNPVSGKAVTLAKGGGSSTITTVSGTTNAAGQASFTVKDTVAESTVYTATDATDGNLAITQTASVTFVPGAVSASNSTVVASPTSIVADGTTTSVITVTLKDANANTVSGKNVTLAKNSGSSTITTVSGVTNAGGQASFTVKDSTAETTTYTATDATDSNLVITQTATVTFVAGSVSASTSTVAASPSSVVADGSTASTITVTLKDANGNPVSGKAVTLAKGGGSSTITTVSGTTNAAGQASFTVKDTVAESTVYTATDATDGNLAITQTASVTFVPGAVSASTSTVVASPTSIVADGTTSVITVTLKDANANTVSGKNVTLAKNSGSSTITTVSGVTNAGGQATFTVKDTVAETTAYTATDATDSNLVITQTATVTFVAGSVSASTSTVAASPSSVVADGSTASTITVTLKDPNGNPVSGKTVTLAKGSGSSTITTVSGTTNGSGQAIFTVKDTVAEATVYTATDTADSNLVITQTATVTFVPGAANKYLVTSSSSSPVAGANVTITAQLADVNNNPVSTSGLVVTWSKTGSGGSFGSPTSTTNASGVATVTFTTSTLAGTVHTVTGTDTGSLTGTTSNITTVAGSATKYLVTSSSSSPAAGTNVTITAQLADVNNNSVSTSGLVVTWSKTGSGGSFGSPTSTTNASGIATVTFTTNTVAGTVHTVTGTDTGSLTGTTSNITTVAGSATKYLVTSSSSSPVAGANVTITAQLSDVNNNSVSTSGLVVTWSKTGSGGSFGSPTSTTNASGVATVTFTTSTVAGTVHTVTGTDTGSLTGTTSNITTVAGAATKYLVTSSSSTPAAGTNVTITAQLADVNNNSVSTSGLVVTWSKTGSGGSFGSPTSTTNASGIATVTFTTNTVAGTVHTVTGTDTGSLTGTTSNITTVAGAAYQYLVTSSDYSPTSGSNVTICGIL